MAGSNTCRPVPNNLAGHVWRALLGHIPRLAPLRSRQTTDLQQTARQTFLDSILDSIAPGNREELPVLADELKRSVNALVRYCKKTPPRW